MCNWADGGMKNYLSMSMLMSITHCDEDGRITVAKGKGRYYGNTRTVHVIIRIGMMDGGILEERVSYSQGHSTAFV